jgi:hypothetical protein
MTAALFAIVACLGAMVLVMAALVTVIRRIRWLQKEFVDMARRVALLETDGWTPGPGAAHPGLEDKPDRAIHSPAEEYRTESSPVAPAPADAVEQASAGSRPGDPSRSANRARVEFNQLASRFNQAELEAFERRWSPKSFTRSADSLLVEDPTGRFWIIPTDEEQPTGPRRGVVVPGPEIVRKWEIYYRALSSLAAKNLLEAIYELRDDAPLRLERAATAIETLEGWRIESPGKFSDG